MLEVAMASLRAWKQESMVTCSPFYDRNLGHACFLQGHSHAQPTEA